MEDIVYHVVIQFRWDNTKVIDIHEYPVTSETHKSLMSGSKRFPKDTLDEPIIDHWNGHFYTGTLTMYETTREEVEEFGVPKLKEAVKEWLTERRDYYENRIKMLE